MIGFLKEVEYVLLCVYEVGLINYIENSKNLGPCIILRNQLNLLSTAFFTAPLLPVVDLRQPTSILCSAGRRREKIFLVLPLKANLEGLNLSTLVLNKLQTNMFIQFLVLALVGINVSSGNLIDTYT